MHQLTLDSPLISPIYWGNTLSPSHGIQSLCSSDTPSVIVITDDHVKPLHGTRLVNHLHSQAIHAHLISIPPGETSKSRQTKSMIEDRMFSLACGRDTLIIAMGGGMVTDLAGFVAATYCRGVPIIYIPTSLLAMVDAAIGGKTGINTRFGKNTLGTFSHPNAIVIDTQWLATLPDQDYQSALPEMLKHGLIYDADYVGEMTAHLDQLIHRDIDALSPLILKSLTIKSRIVSQDETENAQREILNFGHTIGHAIEHATHYHLTHGQAVALGMIAESFIAYRLGHLSLSAFEEIKNLIDRLPISQSTHLTVSAEAIYNACQWDKKNRQQRHRCVLLNQIGAVVDTDQTYAHVIDNGLLKEAIHYLLNAKANLP